MLKIIKLVTALFALLAMLFSGFFFLDSRHASARDVTKIEKRLDLHELEVLLKRALENLYFYREQARRYPNDLDIKRRLDEAEEEVQILKKQIENKKSDNL